MSEKIPKDSPESSHLERLTGKPQELLMGVRDAIASAVANFEPTDLKHSLQYLDGTVGFLRQDSDRCFTLYKESLKRWLINTRDQGIYQEIQFHLRQLIRTFFAEVEGTLYAIRQVILWAHGRGEFALTPGEVSVFREETYRFNARSLAVEAKSSFNNTKDAFLLAFTYLPRLLNPDFSLDLSDNGWECFQKLLNVRNELMHPKGMKLLIDNAVITEILPRARVWYYEALKAAVGAQKN